MYEAIVTCDLPMPTHKTETVIFYQNHPKICKDKGSTKTRHLIISQFPRLHLNRSSIRHGNGNMTHNMNTISLNMN